jgi:hypothetical protein
MFYVRVGILLTCGKHLHACIISLKREVQTLYHLPKDSNLLRNLRMYVENCDDRFFFVADKSNVVRSTMYREIIYIINKMKKKTYHTVRTITKIKYQNLTVFR